MEPLLRGRNITLHKCTGVILCENLKYDQCKNSMKYQSLSRFRSLRNQICKYCQQKMKHINCSKYIMFIHNPKILQNKIWNSMVLNINQHNKYCLVLKPRKPRPSTKAYVCVTYFISMCFYVFL